MLKHLSLIVLLLSSASSWAERGLLSGSLGTWLNSTAAPKLVEVLGKHPKFKGERIRFATLTDGAPAQQGNRLASAVEQLLTREILRAGKTDVAWRAGQRTCQSISKDSHYLIGIEMVPAGPYNHQLDIKILDTDEGVWVSGISLAWQGRLLASENKAFNTPVSHAEAGSMANPVPLKDSQEVARALSAQAVCTLTHPLAGHVLVKPPAAGALRAVMVEFEQQMAVRPQMSLTRSGGDAEWQLDTALEPARFNTQQLSLQLTPSDGAATQTIASIYVLADPRVQRPPQLNAQAPAPTAAQLMSALRIDTKPDACSGRRSDRCVQIRFELNQAAYVSVFRTHNAELKSTDCKARSELRSPGAQVYRINLSGPERTGFYVIASRQRQVMRALRQQINKAPGACGRRGSGAHDTWLHDTIDLIERHADQITWRALHLRDTPAGIEQT